MRFASFLLAIFLVVACGAAAPTPLPIKPSGGPLLDAAAAIEAARRLTSIHGPWTVEEVREGTYADRWEGSTSDLTGQQAADLRAKGSRPAWRARLTGPEGRDELILDRETGTVINAVTQGREAPPNTASAGQQTRRLLRAEHM